MKKILKKILAVTFMISVFANAAYAAPVEYSVPVKVVKASDRTQESMGAKAVDEKIKVIEDNGKYKYIIKTKELEAKGLKGHLTNLIYKDNGKREELKKLPQEKIYTNNYELTTNDKKSEITFAVWVDAMDELMGGGPGSGEQDVVFLLNWNDAKTAVNNTLNSTNNASEYKELKINVNGKNINSDVKPYIKNGRTMVPVRFVSEELGLNISWDASARKVTVKDNSTSAELMIGSDKMKKDNTEIKLDAPAEIKDGRTFVPVRAVAEIFNAKVSWDSASRTVIIEK